MARPVTLSAAPTTVGYGKPGSLHAPADSRPTTLLADPALRRSLGQMVRRRLPESEVEDVVQSTLIEALASSSAPEDPDELRRWVFGVARHKTADYHRKARRESPTSDPPEPEAEDEPHSARDMLRWAEGELPTGDTSKETLEWLLREGEGEKLEAIAASEKLPAPRVRQRVVRLRKHFRERWAAELAGIVAATLAIGLLLWLWKRQKPEPVPPIAREVPSAQPDSPSLRAQDLRKLALERCAAQAWDDCVQGLDRAKALDEVGDQAEEIVRARQAAAAARAPSPPAPSAIPSSPRKLDDSTAPPPKPPAPTTTPPAPSPSGPLGLAPAPGTNGNNPAHGKTNKASSKPAFDSLGTSEPTPAPTAPVTKEGTNDGTKDDAVQRFKSAGKKK